MSDELVVAIIGATAGLIAGVIGATASILIGLKNWKAERKKFEVENEIMTLEAKKLRRDIVETEFVKVQELLELFDSAAFTTMDYDKDPTAVLSAIEDRRITLQTSSKAVIRSPEINAKFREVQKYLLGIVEEASINYPKTFEVWNELSTMSLNSKERLAFVYEKIDAEERENAAAFLRDRSSGGPFSC
ncbi:hypothetical protein ACFLXI_08485 [Chloroflexota bacterium]